MATRNVVLSQHQHELVESLVRRGIETDLQEAQAVINQLAAVPTEPGFVLYEVALRRLRAITVSSWPAIRKPPAAASRLSP